MASAMSLGGIISPWCSTPIMRPNNAKSASGGSDVVAPLDSGVSTPPGHTQLARTPSKASSTAIDFIQSSSAPLDAQYAELYGWPWMPEIDATVTMLPPAALIFGSAARVTATEPT